jgi:hypothetical protein
MIDDSCETRGTYLDNKSSFAHTTVTNYGHSPVIHVQVFFKVVCTLLLKFQAFKADDLVSHACSKRNKYSGTFCTPVPVFYWFFMIFEFLGSRKPENLCSSARSHSYARNDRLGLRSLRVLHSGTTIPAPAPKGTILTGWGKG